MPDQTEPGGFDPHPPEIVIGWQIDAMARLLPGLAPDLALLAEEVRVAEEYLAYLRQILRGELKAMSSKLVEQWASVLHISPYQTSDNPQIAAVLDTFVGKLSSLAENVNDLPDIGSDGARDPIWNPFFRLSNDLDYLCESWPRLRKALDNDGYTADEIWRQIVVATDDFVRDWVAPVRGIVLDAYFCVAHYTGNPLPVWGITTDADAPPG